MMDIGSNNGTIITANPDMVSEVKVQTSNYAAEHGTSSVLINATTKGGAKDFHGSLYDYSRDHTLGANDRSNSINLIQKPDSTYNYPGGNIGGPVYLPKKVFGPLGGFNENKDKLFFFVGYEYYYQRVDEGSKLGRVPSLKMRNGDFSELLPILGPDGNPVANQPNYFGIARKQLTVPAGCVGPGYVGRSAGAQEQPRPLRRSYTPGTGARRQLPGSEPAIRVASTTTSTACSAKRSQPVHSRSTQH
jgi:hypothetical protein